MSYPLRAHSYDRFVIPASRARDFPISFPLRGLTLFVGLLAAVPLSAEEPARTVDSSALIDRPLVLRPLSTQTFAEVDVANTSGATGSALAVGFDMGVQRRLDVGLLVAFPMYPLPNFGTLLASLATPLRKISSFRFEFGLQRMTLGAFTRPVSLFQAAISFPVRKKLSRMFAFTMADSRSGFASNLGGAYTGTFGTSNALVGVAANGSQQTVFFNLPVGFLFQPHPSVWIEAGVGVRGQLVLATRQPFGGFFTVPISAEVGLSFLRRFDAGCRFELPGPIYANALGAPYAGIRLFGIWMRGRF